MRDVRSQPGVGLPLHSFVVAKDTIDRKPSGYAFVGARKMMTRPKSKRYLVRRLWTECHRRTVCARSGIDVHAGARLWRPQRRSAAKG